MALNSAGGSIAHKIKARRFTPAGHFNGVLEKGRCARRKRFLDGPGAGLACARAVPSCARIKAQNQDSEEKATKGSVMGS
jgi:hypothetical protein